MVVSHMAQDSLQRRLDVPMLSLQASQAGRVVHRGVGDHGAELLMHLGPNLANKCIAIIRCGRLRQTKPADSMVNECITAILGICLC